VSALVAVYLLTPGALGANYRLPALAACGCACGGLGIAIGLTRAGLPALFVPCVALLFLPLARMSWRFVPTADGWSNSRADAAAERAVERFTNPRLLVPSDLGEVWADTDRLVEHYPLQADSGRAARAAWDTRFDKEMRALETGELDPMTFTENQSMRATIASQVPGHRERVRTAERAWGDHVTERLIARLDGLPTDGDLRGSNQQWHVLALTDSFPDLLAKLEAAEQAWRERVAGQFAAAIRDADPAATAPVLARRATANAFLAKHPGCAAPIREAEAEWCRRCLGRGIGEADKLEKSDPSAAADLLVLTFDRLKTVGGSNVLPAELKAVLTRVVARAIDDGRQLAKESIRADRFRAAAAAADKLHAKLTRAAALAELTDDLNGFQKSCRFLADVAEKAGQPDAP
jgi:hypothetical protein